MRGGKQPGRLYGGGGWNPPVPRGTPAKGRGFPQHSQCVRLFGLRVSQCRHHHHLAGKSENLS